MNNYLKLIIPLGCFWATSCKIAPKELEENEIANPKTSVQVVTVQYGSVEDELLLSATTIYLKRNIVTATIPAFITAVRIKLGDEVKRGDVLFEMESKERRALGNSVSKLDSGLSNFGLLKIRATASGVISTLDKQQSGDYVLEGTQLCTIAESNDLAFQVNVPYEFTPYSKQGKSCVIILPDNTSHAGQFTKSLTSMNVTAQTQTILAKVFENLLLPENLTVKVMVSKGTTMNKQILPTSCVSSDEMMEEFWIMKLINDSTAIKTPVTIGNKNTEKTEILAPQFNSTDRIISIGGYALPDTALVKIVTGKTE